ncbi:DNA adenine methylase [Anaerotignum lactatifermentans]|uniref:DNA adenine methylase n=1 Tax=Anaerotignum lactatifermentans TaxID=160404 RepID=UPI00307BE5A0
MVNSMIPWIGGKRLMREFLIARFPPHYDKYVEVFGGAGWVLFAKKPERFEVYNDANSNLTNMFHVVKHKPMSFVKELGFLPLNSRAEFDLMLDWHRKQDFSLPYQTEEMALAKIYLSPIDFREYKELITTQAELGDVRRAATFYKLIRYSYAAGGNSFNGQPVNIAQTYRTIWLANRRLNENGVKSSSEMALAGGNPGKGVIIQNKSFEVIIALYDSPTTFFYLDPPYYGTEKQYEELFTLELHYLLREVLGKIEGFFMLSYNDCEFIRELYKDFYITPFERLNSIAQKYTPGGMFKELVITNYDPNLRLNSQPKQLTLL